MIPIQLYPLNFEEFRKVALPAQEVCAFFDDQKTCIYLENISDNEKDHRKFHINFGLSLQNTFREKSISVTMPHSQQSPSRYLLSTFGRSLKYLYQPMKVSLVKKVTAKSSISDKIHFFSEQNLHVSFEEEYDHEDYIFLPLISMQEHVQKILLTQALKEEEKTVFQIFLMTAHKQFIEKSRHNGVLISLQKDAYPILTEHYKFFSLKP